MRRSRGRTGRRVSRNASADEDSPAVFISEQAEGEVYEVRDYPASASHEDNVGFRVEIRPRARWTSKARTVGGEVRETTVRGDRDVPGPEKAPVVGDATKRSDRRSSYP